MQFNYAICNMQLIAGKYVQKGRYLFKHDVCAVVAAIYCSKSLLVSVCYLVSVGYFNNQQKLSNRQKISFSGKDCQLLIRYV